MYYYNKIKLLSIVLSIIISTCANSAYIDKSKFKGIYIGASGGYLTTNSKVTRTEIEIVERQSHFKMSDSAPTFSVLAGYGNYLVDNLYLGVEGMISTMNYKSRYTHDNTASTAFEHHMDRSCAFAARIGWNIKNFMLAYAKIGYISTHMQFKATEAIPGALDTRKTSNGIIVGLGADFELRPNIICGIELSCLRYKSITAEIPDVTRYKITPQANSLVLKVAWMI